MAAFTTMKQIVNALRGLFGHSDAGGVRLLVERLTGIDNMPIYYKAVDANAAATLALTYMYEAKYDLTMVQLSQLAQVAATVALHDTNFASYLIDKHDGAGGAGTLVATETTETGGQAIPGAGVNWDIPITAGSENVDAGEVLSLEVTKGGTGNAMPGGNILLTAIPR